MFNKIRREPVLVVTFVGAVLNLLIVFGIDLTQEQTASILVLLNAGLAFIARSKVTPVDDPSLF